MGGWYIVFLLFLEVGFGKFIGNKKCFQGFEDFRIDIQYGFKEIID